MTDKYAKILVYLIDINPEWLLTGAGEMLRETYSNVLPVPSVPSENSAPHECIYKELLKEKDSEIKAQAKEIGRLEAENIRLKSDIEDLKKGSIRKSRIAVPAPLETVGG